jgi:hypothetical protein
MTYNSGELQPTVVYDIAKRILRFDVSHEYKQQPHKFFLSHIELIDFYLTKHNLTFSINNKTNYIFSDSKLLKS